MRILFIHQAFHPDPAGAARVLYDLASELARRKHQVTVLTANRVYSTDAPLSSSEIVNSVTVQRLPVLGSRRSYGTRLLAMLSFTGSALWQLPRLVKTHDVVVVSTLPPFLAAPSGRVARRMGRAFVYLCHDIYPDILASSGYTHGLLGRIVSSVLERQTRLALSRASQIVALSESMREVLIRKEPTIAERVTVIPNFANAKRIYPVPRENRWATDQGLVGRRVVLYAGNMGQSHNLELLLEAAKIARAPDLLFVFVGDGARRSWLEQEVERLKLANVRFLPFQREEDLSEMLGTAMVSVVALEPSLDGLAVPSKLYSIMASARPVLVLQPPEGELARIVQKLGIGFSASDPYAVLSVIERLSERDLWRTLGIRAYRAFRMHFSVEVACDVYERVFNEAVSANRGH